MLPPLEHPVQPVRHRDPKTGAFIASLAPTLAIALAVGVALPSHAQNADLRGSIEERDAAADSFDEAFEPTDPTIDDDAPAPAATTFDDTVDEAEPVTLRRAANGRLVPSRPGLPTASNAGRQGRARRVQPAQPVAGIQDDGGLATSQANTPLRTVQGGGGARPAPGPYDPLGTRVGPLDVVVGIEQSLGYTSNAEFASGGGESVVSETRFNVDAVSDLPVHEFRGSLNGSFRKFTEDAESLPTLDAAASFRYDVRRDTTLTVGGTYSLATESATDDSLLGLPRAVDGRPLVHTGNISVEAARTGGRLFGSLRGSVGREVYGDIEFVDGTSRSQFDREATLFETALRIGYAHTPAFQPFIEGEIGYRRNDEREDRNGQNRDAARYALRGGVQLDLGEKLTGSLAAGIESVVYESNRFDTLTGPSLEAQLNWSPDRLTRIDVTASTLFDDAVTTDLAGALDYRLAVNATRDLRENLSLFGTISVALRDPGGDSERTTFNADAGLAYSLNRSLALTGRLGYTNVRSEIANSSYDVKTATIGLRWQK